ncbi:MAG: hypothetical protein H6510_04580 [Acidobacteria bacterium]|nr:hypothetical protein [Acidobacteriota bacterium]MCB9397072.1 hypothetical protein [Acidobacteriota bacterium]
METVHSDPNYFNEATQSVPRLKWLTKAVKVSRLLPLDHLEDQINEKVARLVRRKPDMDGETRAQIIENIVRAKILKKFQTWKAKQYDPKPGKKSPSHSFRQMAGEQFERCRCSIIKEKNFKIGRYPAILVPGFIPDGNEAFFLLRRSFLKYGPVFYVNYPPHHFNKEVLFHQLYDMIWDLNRRSLKNAGVKPRPFLVGTSFGCRIILSFMQWLDDNNLRANLDIKGLVLLSPVLCLEDVVDPTSPRQKTLVGRAVSHLCEVEPDDVDGIDQAMGRARNIFSKMFTSGRDQLKFNEKEQLGVMAIEDEVLRIFDPEFTPNQGVFQRYMGLKTEKALSGAYMSDLPTLVLFAEGESDVLTPNAPTYHQLINNEFLHQVFPNGHVEVVYSLDEKRRVTHSDLIFQADRYLAHIKPWLKLQTS